MNASLFDIDGTLLGASDADSGLFIGAVRGVLGDVLIRPDWGEYVHVTYIGILREIHAENRIDVHPATIRAVREAYVASLQAYVAEAGPFPEIPGAVRYINQLLWTTPGRVAYATGGWRDSAKTKLWSAGFSLANVPLASADDHEDRQSIMRSALAQLEGPIQTVTYYGDRRWDEAAAAELGWRFVPVGARLKGLASYPGIATSDVSGGRYVTVPAYAPTAAGQG